jgi:hypothetical protein
VPPLDGMRDVLRDLGSSATLSKVTVADDLSNLEDARAAAREADVVVLMAGLVATEGVDQPDANMLNDQNRMLDELLGINPTVQVYLGVPVPGQPPKRLVGFRKVFVEPGESRPVTITIDPAATNHPFDVWDYCTRRFVTEPGEYTVHVGNAADNTPHAASVTVG